MLCNLSKTSSRIGRLWSGRARGIAERMPQYYFWMTCEDTILYKLLHYFTVKFKSWKYPTEPREFSNHFIDIEMFIICWMVIETSLQPTISIFIFFGIISAFPFLYIIIGSLPQRHCITQPVWNPFNSATGITVLLTSS